MASPLRTSSSSELSPHVGLRLQSSFLGGGLSTSIDRLEKYLRIAVLGDPQCGKTTLISKWTEKSKQSPETPSSEAPSIANDKKLPVRPPPKKSLGVELPHVSTSVQDHKFRVHFLEWDVHIKENNNNTNDNSNSNSGPFNGIDGVVLCYDTTSPKSFEHLGSTWKAVINKYDVTKTACVLIVGCKGDLPASVDPTLISMLCKFADGDTVVSGVTGLNLDTALSTLVSDIMNHSQKIKKKTDPLATELVDLKRGRVGNSPHEFVLKYFKGPTFCKFCDNFIWGVASPQGFRCNNCGYTVHKKCLEDVPHMCTMELAETDKQ